jgi:hypothetical protein
VSHILAGCPNPRGTDHEKREICCGDFNDSSQVDPIVVLLLCLASASPLWANTVVFDGLSASGQGSLAFTPGIGNTLVIGAGNGAAGAPVTDFFIIPAGSISSIVGGYLTLTSGPETSGSAGGGIFS